MLATVASMLVVVFVVGSVKEKKVGVYGRLYVTVQLCKSLYTILLRSHLQASPFSQCGRGTWTPPGTKGVGGGGK